MRFWNIKLSLIVLFLSTLNTYSQIYIFDSFAEDDGLEANYIYSINQSANGFLQLATEGGLVTYNGLNFKTYTANDSLAENFTTQIFKDSRNITWLGHYQNGISYQKEQTFSKLKGSDAYESKVIAFAEDKSKNIWFIVQGVGLYFIDSTFNIHAPKFEGYFVPNSIAIDNEGLLLCGTDDGFFYYDIDNPETPIVVNTIQALEYMSVKAIEKDRLIDDLYWLAVPGEGVYAVKKVDNSYKIAIELTSRLNSISKNILTLLSDSKGDLWISIADEGLKKIHFSEEKIHSVKTINQRNGLSANFVQSIYEDFEGTIWLGTFGKGLIKMPTEHFNFYRPKVNTNIKSIVLGDSSHIWLGTKHGLSLYELENDSIKTIYNSKNGFIDDKVNALYKDDNNNIWIGTAQNGLYIRNSSTGKIKKYSSKKNLDNVSINWITTSPKGEILVASKEGAYFINPTTNEVKLMSTADGMLHNNVLHAFSDSKGRIWFSSHGTPPYYLLGDDFTALKQVEMKTYTVNSVAEDNSGNIWIATGGDGLYSYDETEVKNYKVKSGLLSNFCYGLVANNTNEIWVSHNNGLTNINTLNNSLTTYNKGNKLMFTQNNINALAKGRNSLWFGTTEGFVKQDTRHDKEGIIEPKTTILSVGINNKEQNISEALNLPYGDYDIKIKYIGISLIKPENVRYKYRLIGLDSTWRYTKEPLVEFRKLSDGNYTFQLFAGDDTNNWNSDSQLYSFKIKVPYWKTIWFWILTIIALGGIVYGIIEWRTRKLIKAKNFLSKTVDEKTSELQKEKLELQKTQKELEENNKEITDSINYAQKIQVAILPSKEKLEAAFPKVSIFYKPRDIVSGDFYWFAETEDAYVIAVVDCTGHGVPGAFMSLIGSSVLNDVVNTRKITVPSKILDELDKGIIKSLQQGNADNTSRDGMDVAICSINKAKTMITLSSASRPIYYMRDGELKMIRSKSYGIGFIDDTTIKEFKDVEMEILPNDTFYLFSDGYADQFDKDDLKKFSAKRLKQLFRDIDNMGKTEQEITIEKTFDDFKGSTEQLDDVTVLGVKV